MKREDYCSYKLSMFGRQMIKQHIVYERRTMIRKTWTSFFLFILSAGMTVFCFMEEVWHLTGLGDEYVEQFIDFAVVFSVMALVCLVLFVLLLRHSFRYCLGKKSDLSFIKKGGYKVDTVYIAGSYRARKRGLGTAGIRMLLEGNREYVIATMRGSSVHAVNLTGELIENSYRPCISLDNGSVFVIPRTAVTAPKETR